MTEKPVQMRRAERGSIPLPGTWIPVLESVGKLANSASTSSARAEKRNQIKAPTAHPELVEGCFCIFRPSRSRE